MPVRFYSRNPELVAKELLGKILVRRLGNNLLDGIIVETEAYFGPEDPASRAYHGLKKYNKQMWSNPGETFIYNVHKYWMLNIVAHEPEEIGAILIRAIEPKNGFETMKKNRSTGEIHNLTNGPGKLTMALSINKNQNGVDVTSRKNEIFITNPRDSLEFKVEKSKRRGVRRDLDRKLRFFIKGNKSVS